MERCVAKQEYSKHGNLIEQLPTRKRWNLIIVTSCLKFQAGPCSNLRLLLLTVFHHCYSIENQLKPIPLRMMVGSKDMHTPFLHQNTKSTTLCWYTDSLEEKTSLEASRSSIISWFNCKAFSSSSQMYQPPSVYVPSSLIALDSWYLGSQIEWRNFRKKLDVGKSWEFPKYHVLPWKWKKKDISISQLKIVHIQTKRIPGH